MKSGRMPTMEARTPIQRLFSRGYQALPEL